MAKRNKSNHADEKTPRLSKELFKRSLAVFRYVLPYKGSFLAGMLSLSFGSLLFLGIMKIPGEVFNIISGDSTYGLSLNQVFLVLLLFLGTQGVLSYFRIRFFAIVSEKSMAALREDLYAKLVTLSIPFLEKRRVGELTSRITNDVTQVQSVVSTTLAEFLRQIIVLVGGIVIIIVTMPRLALVMLLTFPIVVVLAMFFGKHIRKLMRERQDKLAETNVVVEETMQNIQTVKAYTNEWFETNRYAKNLKDAVHIALKAAHMRGLFAAFIIFVMFGALFFIMYRAALMVQNGDMLKGDLVDFVVFTGIIGGAIASLGSFYTEIVSAMGATERILDILAEDGEIPPRENKNMPITIEGKIVFEDVWFSYPSRKDVKVLKGISLHLNPGEKVALVGASGAGKSTIVQLLMQFYQIDKGRILVDDKDAYSYDLIGYRQNMAIVPQEVLLFGGTIAENIRYGRSDASDAEIEEAAQKANALEFINSFPDAFDTLVGERGVKLSGGQRQRIAIARAILNDPSVLILDEATSSLDAASEELVQEALNTLMEGRTSIIIAHRLATIRDVDRIYVLDNGVVVEKGTHDELYAKTDGTYHKLAKLQFAAVENESNAEVD